MSNYVTSYDVRSKEIARLGWVICVASHNTSFVMIMQKKKKSDNVIHAVIFNMSLKAPLTSKRREFILWRIPIWLWTDTAGPASMSYYESITGWRGMGLEGELYRSGLPLKRASTLNLRAQKHTTVHPVCDLTLHPYGTCIDQKVKESLPANNMCLTLLVPSCFNWRVCCYILPVIDKSKLLRGKCSMLFHYCITCSETPWSTLTTA